MPASLSASDFVNRSGRIATFVRGYFRWLESCGVPAALLHGWEDGFEGKISDVDYVMDAAAFRNVATRVHEYCSSAGWRLCQVLRHEDTAAFCVCSAQDDPGCVVALDACSDYQRNGLVFLTAGELLDGRQELEWGGFRLSPQMELRYRFIKAAAKAKQSADILPDILAMAGTARAGFTEWLSNSWGVRLDAWDEPNLIIILADLTRRCGPSQSKYRPSNLGRLVRRVVKPDGLLLLMDPSDPARMEAVENVFSGLYFRRHKRVSKATLRERMDLIRSILVIAPATGCGVRAGLGRECVFSPPESISTPDLIQQIAVHLHQRCKSRELGS